MSTSLTTLKIYLSHWRRHPWLTGISFLLGPAYALQAVVAPLFVAKCIGQLASGQSVSTNNVIFAAMSLFGGAALWYLVDQYCSAKLDLLILRDLYATNFDHILGQEYNFFTNNFSGSLVAQANRFVRGYVLFHEVFFLKMLGQLCSVIIALGIMIYYNPLIGSLVSLFWLTSVIFVGHLAIKRMPVRRHAVAAETQQTGELADAVTNAITVKTFASSSQEAKRYSLINNEHFKRLGVSWRLGVRNNSTIQVLCGILQMIVLIGGIYAIQNGKMSITIFLLFEVYVLRIIDSVGHASTYVRELEGIFSDTHEMTELLMRTSKVSDPIHPETLKVQDGTVEFKDVVFTYEQGSKRELFEALNLAIKPGEKVGLVGPSGGGKTTITKLLLRFMDVQGGKILIDGQPIDSVTQDDLRRAVAYVPQEPLMFHRSIMENIRYGKPEASDEEVIAAAKKAHAHNFIKDLPKGYDTLVGERGIKLSGGQRQRVAIARAMLKNAPILILDEATSSLDSESEKAIQTALWELMKDKTAIVIAHRLSTIQRMDRIVVLDKGKIVETGPHKTLLKQKGLYARLWSHQSGGFLEE